MGYRRQTGFLIGPAAPVATKRDPINKGLLGAWLLNDGGGLNLKDWSGYRQSGIITSGAPAATWTKGPKGGAAVGFDGVSSYAALPNTSLQGLSAATWSLWMKQPGSGGNTFGGWFSGDTAYNASFFVGNLDYTEGQVLIGACIPTTFTIPSSWFNLVVVYVGGDSPTVIAYVNGINTSSIGLSFPSTIPSFSGMQIAGPTGNGVSNISAWNARIWNRALGVQEIRRLYAEPLCGITKPRRLTARTTVASAFTATLSNTIATSDTLAIAAFGLSRSDSVTSSDAVTIAGFGLGLGTTNASSDNLTGASALSATLTESAVSSDNLTGVSALSATLAESAVSSTSFTGVVAIATVTLTETVTSSDSVAIAGYVSTTADTVASSDTLTATAYGLQLSDTIATADSVLGSVIATTIALTDTTLTSEIIFGSIVAIAALTDVTANSDNLIGGAISVNRSDTVATSEALSTSLGYAPAALPVGFFVPNTARFLLPEARFDALISEVGQRVGWMRSHACPCTYSPTTINNQLSTPGSAQRSCKTCFGIGFYWDAPGPTFRAYMSFMHVAATPDEPGTVMNPVFGPVQTGEPSLTIPYHNPNLLAGDPAQPTQAWINVSTDDLIVPVDMTARSTAMLQVGGITHLPFQQNLQIAPTGAVTVWNSATYSIQPVSNYVVNGSSVTITNYPIGTTYMVEFIAAPVYVVWKRAGGMPHVRPFGGGTDNLPRRFRLEALDPWLRQRGSQNTINILPVTGNATGALSETVKTNDTLADM